ncbi:MAG: hypothetical protein HWE27_18755 [Gammaproteobacteria bacterium]|nr:hypothetical protein [Gammaproteobacteria bacterium]
MIRTFNIGLCLLISGCGTKLYLEEQASDSKLAHVKVKVIQYPRGHFSDVDIYSISGSFSSKKKFGVDDHPREFWLHEGRYDIEYLCLGLMSAENLFRDSIVIERAREYELSCAYGDNKFKLRLVSNQSKQ